MCEPRRLFKGGDLTLSLVRNNIEHVETVPQAVQIYCGTDTDPRLPPGVFT